MHRTIRKIFAGSLALILALTGVEFGGVTRALAAFALPQSLVRIEDEAFRGDAMLTGRVDIPEQVVSVGKRAFEQSGVYAIVFPQSVSFIGADALTNTDASYAMVCNADAQIEAGAFASLSYLFGEAGSTAQAYAEAAGIEFVALDALVLEGGFYYAVDDTATLLCAADATQISGEWVLPETVGGKTLALIRENAFAGCGALSKLTIPAGVTMEEGALNALTHTEIIQLKPSLEITKITSTVTGSVYAGKKPMWAVRAQGGEGVVRYRFELTQDASVIAEQDYATKNYFSYTLNEPGDYVVHVTCRDDAQNSTSASSEKIRVLAQPLEITGVSCDTSLGVVGEAITWTVATENGSAPVQYSYELLRDGLSEHTQDFADSASFTYIPTKAGYYVLNVTCLDADATIVQQQSAIVTVLTAEEAKPAAPVLIFEDETMAFAQEEALAPTYDGQSITLVWNAVDYADFYDVTLERQENGEWVNVYSEESLIACSARLDASLFAQATERTIYRLGMASQGVRAGEMRYTYFAVEKIEVDESLLVNGATSIVWDQAHCYDAIRGFEVTSQLPWTAQTAAEWVECLTLDDGTLCVKLHAQEEIAERTATVTVSNGVNTVIISITQGTTQTPPTLLIPAISTDSQNPTSIPVGDFTLEWDDQGHDYGLLRIYEVYSGGAVRKIYGVYLTRDYFYLTQENIGEALKAGSTYMIELAGFYSSDCKTNEVEADALKQQYYFTATAEGHSILVNGERTVTLSDITSDTVFVSASNYFTCQTDADWLTASISLKNSTESAVKIKATVNDTASARTGHVTLTCGTAQAVVTVCQQSMLPQILKPAGLSQNESSPTTLYADLNKLNTSYEFFLYRGEDLSIAQGSAGTYGDETSILNGSTFTVHDARMKTSLISGGQYRLKVTNGDLVSYYYVKFADNDEEPYDDIVLDGSIMRRKVIGASAQTMTVGLDASTSWKATSDASWLTVSQTSGSKGTYTLTLNAAANTTGAARTGIVSVRSTVSECEGWVVVEQSAQDYMEVYYNGDFGYETYDAAKHCAMVEGAEGRTSTFIIYSSLDHQIVSNAAWMTLSSSGATSLTNETGDTFRIYLARNETGAVRTGSLTVTCGAITRTIFVTQAPALGEMVIVSPVLSQDTDNPTIIQHADFQLTWKRVENAVAYSVSTSSSGDQEMHIAENGSAQYSVTVPKSWMEAYSDSYQTLYLYAYDQYGFINKEWYFYQAVTGDAALVNGEAAAEWLDADDTATAKDFTIQASQTWTAKADASWVTLSAASGASGDTLTVSLAENTGAARSASVTITVGSASTVIAIRQCAYLAQENPLLSSPVLSTDKASPTLLTLSDLTKLSLSWEKEPQAWHYSLKLAKCTSDTASKTLAQSGTLRKDTYTFTGLELAAGELYKLTFERYSARYGYTRTVYYFTLASADAWVQVQAMDAYESEMDGGEDHEYLEITASGYWNATTQEDWILLDETPVHQADLDEDGVTAAKYHSYGNVSGKTLCISVLANGEAQPRTGTVTVTSGSASATITVKQYQNYQIAQITSPTLSTTTSETPRLSFGSVALRWSGAQGGTGKYEITVYESEAQRTGYYQIYEKTGLNASSHTIPESEFTQGLYYRVWLGTELADGDYAGKSYYFQMGRKDELTATISIAKTEATVGQHLGVTVSASGGAGGYKYAYQLLQGDTVIEESAYENIAYYSFAPTQEGTYAIRVYVKDADGTVISVDSQSFSAQKAPDSISLSRSVWAAGAAAESIAVTVEAGAAWTVSASESWISTSVSGSSATISVSENTTSASRSGMVTFVSGSASATLQIAQEAKAADGAAAIALSMGVWNITDVNSASLANLTITCDGAWTAANLPDWISMTMTSGTGSATIQLYAAANLSDARSAQIDFSCGGEQVSLLVAQAGNELAPRVTAVSVTDSAPLTGEEVTFTVAAANTDTVIFTVDGTPYEQIYVTNGTATYTRAFSEGGVREVAFVPVRGSAIGTASDTLTMNVESYGDLNAPTITCKTDVELGERVTVFWGEIAHADYYVVKVWRDDVLLLTQPRWETASYDLTADVLSGEGTYTFHVMAVGAGYSQSESAEFIVVSMPSTTAKLTAPGAGDTFDIGNTLGLQASNPEGRPITLHLYKGGEQIAVFPAEGTVSALDPYYEYTLTQAGTYQANLNVYGAAGNVIATTAKISFSVSGPTIESGTQIGTGAKILYTDEAASFTVVTNTAVTAVTVNVGEKSYTGAGGAIDTSNWTRTFTGTMDVPAEGKHVATVTASDDYQHAATKKLTYYAVTRDQSGTTVYPQRTSVDVLSTPDAAAASATMAPSDKATLLGSCGDYRYIDFGGVKGFVHKDAIGETRMTTWDGLNIAVPLLISRDIPGCILASHKVNIYWTSSVVLPASAQYRMSLVDANGVVTKMYQGAYGSCEVAMNTLKAGKYTVRVEVVSSDNAVTYFTRNTAYGLNMKETYTEYFAAMDAEKFRVEYTDVMTDQENLSNLYRFFTTGYTSETGELYKADLNKLTENALMTAYHKYFGDTLTAMGEKNLRRVSIAEAIMDHAAKETSSVADIDYGSLKRCLQMMGVPLDMAAKISAAQEMGGKLKSRNPQVLKAEFDELTQKHSLDGILKGVETGITIGATLTTIWAKYLKYSSVDHAEVDKIITQLEETGDTELIGVAHYLRALNDEEKLLVYLVMGHGGKAVMDACTDVAKNTVEELIEYGISHLPGGFAFTIGTSIGKAVGVAVNNFVFNVDEIQNKACELKWRIDATQAYYERYRAAYSDYLQDPVSNYKTFAEASIGFEKMLAIIYQGWADFCKASDESGWSKFIDFVCFWAEDAQLSTQAQYHADTLSAMALKNLGTSLDTFYYDFLIMQGVEHVEMPSIWAELNP